MEPTYIFFIYGSEWQIARLIPSGDVFFAHLKTLNYFEILLDKELAATCHLVTKTKFGELILISTHCACAQRTKCDPLPQNQL